ncbi:sensor domain-containing diguanylate cyclase [Enterobacter sp. Bisph1]|uniref:sensor domain-containing diguanylate cyclase n=1 Tax=Enterobacter sp. Bisph1 TaxID=1274399 RepID=UPI00057C0A0E|nr:sensor domain-containing diguanylate cyclase [Enterobacter sp. Bisph1]
MNNEKKRLNHRDEDAKHLFELLHNNSDWVWEVDAQGRYTWTSDVVTELLGVPPEEVIGKTPFDFMPPGEAERVAGAFGAIVTEKRAFSGLVNRNQRADGSVVVLETSGIPLFDEQGELRGYRGIDRNISHLGERVLQLETIYQTTPVALCMIDRAGRLVMSNNAMAKLLGDVQETESHFQRLMPDYWPFFISDFALADRGEPLPSRELSFRDRSYDLQAVPVKDAMDTVIGLSVTWVDITERRHAEHKLASANKVLQQFAQHDHLTGLFNRRYMDECLLAEIARSLEDGFPLSVCLADIDYFKNYNDNKGHQAGDDCLRLVARTLAVSHLRSGYNVSRYGGEEFLIILPGTNLAQARDLAEGVRGNISALNVPHNASPTGFLTISIGVATLQAGQVQSEGKPLHMIASGLIHRADTALYAAKKQGRNQVVSALENSVRVSGA